MFSKERPKLSEFLYKNLTIFLFAVLITTNTFSIPEIVKGFLSASVFFFLPFITGVTLSEWIIKKYQINYDFFFMSIFYWSLGSLFIWILSLLMSLLNLFSLYGVILILCLLLIINLKDFHKSLFSNLDFDLNLKNISILTGLGLYGILAAIFIRSRSPFPFQVNWDMFQDLFIIGRISEFNQLLVLSNDYAKYAYYRFSPSFFKLLVSLATEWASSNPLSVFWTAPYIQASLYSVFIYLFTYYFSKNQLLSIFSALIGTFLFESKLPLGLLAKFDDDRLIALVFPYLIVSVDRYLVSEGIAHLKKRKNIIFWGVILTTSFLIHPYVTLFLLCFILLHIFLKKIYPNHIRYIRYLPLIIVLFIFLLKYGNFSLLNYYKFNIFVASKVYVPSEVVRFQKLELWYTPLFLYATFFSILLCIFVKRFLYSNYAILSIHCSVLFLLFFLPTNSSRIALFIHLFVAFFSAMLISIMIDLFSRINFRREKTNSILTVEKRNKLFRMFLSLIIFILLIPQIASPISSALDSWSYKTNLNGIATSFTDYELRMGEWIRENTLSNSFILSDPITMQIIRGISYRESFGRVYMRFDNNSQILIEAIKTDDPATTNKLLLSLVSDDYFKDRKIYIVLSGRFAEWMENPSVFPWQPASHIDSHIINKFNDPEYFKLVYEVDEKIYLYEVLKNYGS